MTPQRYGIHTLLEAASFVSHFLLPLHCVVEWTHAQLVCRAHISHASRFFCRFDAFQSCRVSSRSSLASCNPMVPLTASGSRSITSLFPSLLSSDVAQYCTSNILSRKIESIFASCYFSACGWFPISRSQFADNFLTNRFVTRRVIDGMYGKPLLPPQVDQTLYSHLVLCTPCVSV